MVEGGRVSSNGLTLEGTGQSRDKAAEAVGLAPTTYHRAKTWILKQLSLQMKGKLKNMREKRLQKRQGAWIRGSWGDNLV